MATEASNQIAKLVELLNSEYADAGAKEKVKINAAIAKVDTQMNSIRDSLVSTAISVGAIKSSELNSIMGF